MEDLKLDFSFYQPWVGRDYKNDLTSLGILLEILLELTKAVALNNVDVLLIVFLLLSYWFFLTFQLLNNAFLARGCPLLLCIQMLSGQPLAF